MALLKKSSRNWKRVSFLSTTPIRNAELLKVIDNEGIKRVTMCDFKTRNSLSFEMLSLLRTEINKNEESTRCIIIDSDGPVFSAGHNLKQLTLQNGKKALEEIFIECSKLMIDIRKAPVPIIAGVRGIAAAAGCQLVAASDISVAGHNARFSTPGVNFGLFCSTPGIMLTRSVPLKVASYMLFTGNMIDAKEALHHGLVSRVVNESDLDEELSNIANSILKKSKSVVARGKKFLYEQITLDLNEALMNGEKEMVGNLCMRDGQEGISSFAEKRRPIWKHDYTEVEKA